MQTHSQQINQPAAKHSVTPRHLLLFRDHLKDLNDGEPLTQDQAAQLLGVSRVTWNRWENSKTTPPAYLLKTLRAIIAAHDKQNEAKNHH
jgi:DNA-binding XRE family transcriptional regulator